MVQQESYITLPVNSLGHFLWFFSSFLSFVWYSMCLSQVRNSSITNPNDLVWLTCFMTLPWALTAGIVPADSSSPTLWWLPMIINSVFSAFRLSLLDLSHSQIFKNSGTSLLLMSLSFLIPAERSVSSAYIDIFAVFTILGKSFMHIINNNGPRMEPWGTPTKHSMV